jgi:signal transduction histidine kinase
MEDSTERMNSTLKRYGASGSEALQSLMAELWGLRVEKTPPDRVVLHASLALGEYYLNRGCPPSGAVREVLQLGRALVDDARGRGELDAEGAARLRALVDEAAVQTARAVELARRARRQSWLAFLVHELKNPLNTVLNALWLLREKGADKTQAARFIELAERAVRRLESHARDVRQLDEELLTPPAGWQPQPQKGRAPA